MEFGHRVHPPKRIAVIGAGISGMGAAYLLSKTNKVVLFESEKRLGGHARTVTAGKYGNQPVDTGFIVFNKANYPNITKLFNDLEVKIVNSNMTFGASFDGGRLEYGLASLNSVFAQRQNAFRPKFLRMLKDITKFNYQAESVSKNSDMSIEQLLKEVGTSSWFKDYYLFPLTGAIWSMPVEQMESFPAEALVNFMKNHALLSMTGQHQWLTISGGSIKYVEKLEQRMKSQNVEIRLGCKVNKISRNFDKVSIKTQFGLEEEFDEVVLATHADDTLSLLADPTEHEKTSLGAIHYQENDAVLHADQSLMPVTKRVWSSWVYSESKNKNSKRIDLTYWMNSLQSIPKEDPIFVTLNSSRNIKQELIYDSVTYRHPVYDLKTLSSQQKIKEINGQNRTWFAGAWMQNGFHEDGYSSAINVATKLMNQSRAELIF